MITRLGAFTLFVILVSGLIFGLQKEEVNAGGNGGENFYQIESESNRVNRPESGFSGILGQLGGTVEDVVVQGDYAYIGVGPRLVVLDISNPITPTLVGRSEILLTEGDSGYVGSLAASGNYVYALIWGNLTVIDVTNPANPYAVFSDSNLASQIEVSGDRAYTIPSGTVNGNARMRILDISDPFSISEIGYFDVPSMVFDMHIQGNYAYFATEAGLIIVDITSSSNPIPAGTFNDHEGARAVDVVGSLAYVVYGIGTGSLRIIDVSDPGNADEMGDLFLANAASNIAVSGDYAYLVGRLSGDLRIVDISDPEIPVGAGMCNLPGWFPDLAVDGDYVFVAGRSGGFLVADVQDPDDPVVISSYGVLPSPVQIAASNDYLYVTDTYAGLIIFDISTPEEPLKVGQLEMPEYTSQLLVHGSYAYVSTNDISVQRSTLHVVDIANPSLPADIGAYTAPRYIRDLEISGNYILAAAGDSGLRIVDVSNPANPVEISNFPTSDEANAVAVSGNMAFVADGSWGLRVVDISNPAEPVEIGAYQTGQAGFSEVTVQGNLLILSGWFPLGLVILDVSRPDEPMEALTVNIELNSIIVQGEFMYGQTMGWLYAYWLALPNIVHHVSYSRPLFFYGDLTAVDDMIYATDGYNGLVVLSFDSKGLLMPRALIPLTMAEST